MTKANSDAEFSYGPLVPAETAMPPSPPIFHEPWWLDAVAPGMWGEAHIERDGEVIARWPYVVKKRFGIKAIGNPRLTPFLGPWWKPLQGKRATRLQRAKEIIDELLGVIPQAHSYYFPCIPELGNMLPFYWKGFSLGVRYTHRIYNAADEDGIWNMLSMRTRNTVRKAMKCGVRVRSDLGFDDFWNTYVKTFARQDMDPPCCADMLRRLDEELGRRDRKCVLFACGPDGHTHAVSYIVWDKCTAYYLMGGADTELRKSGAQSLILWHSILEAGKRGLVFDFEGSMMEPVARFFRSFGAIPTPCYIAHKKAYWLRLVQDLIGGVRTRR